MAGREALPRTQPGSNGQVSRAMAASLCPAVPTPVLLWLGRGAECGHGRGPQEGRCRKPTGSPPPHRARDTEVLLKSKGTPP